MKKILGVVAVVTLAWGLARAPAFADDVKINCVNVGDDGGTTGFVTIPTQTGEAVIRCDNHNVRHRFGIGASTVATSTDSILDADKSIILCPGGENTRVSFFKPFDGGTPACCVYRVKPKVMCP